MSSKLSKPHASKPRGVFWSSPAFFVLLAAVILAFSGCWISVCLTAGRMEQTLSSMAEGKDYFLEEVRILKKDSSSSTHGDSSVESTNYYFYYGSASEQKLFVDEDTYRRYQPGDKIPAYTLDHRSYGFTKEEILPDKIYRNNELKKALGVLLGAGILALLFLRWCFSPVGRKSA